MTDIENSNSNNNEGKYDYDVNRAMENTMVSETEHSNNSINSDYSDDEYDSNRITENEGGNVLNETGAVNGIASNEDDQDSKIIKSKDKKSSTEAQSVKKNNDSITNTSGILDFNEKENITNDYKKVLYDLYYDDEIN